jgi:hypothetical protein
LNLLDENFPEDQRPLLRAWRIPFRQIGREVSRLGIKDADIIPVLHRHRRVTFLTQDKGFFDKEICHPLFYLDVPTDDAAYNVRLFLRHTHFNSVAKRMGSLLACITIAFTSGTLISLRSKKSNGQILRDRGGSAHHYNSSSRSV